MALFTVLAVLLSVSPPSAWAAEEFRLDYDVPAGWYHQHVRDQAEFTKPGIEMRLVRVPVDKGSELDTQGALDDQLREMSRPFIEGSVEGEAKITPITGRFGGYAVFTDSTLVGKTVSQGQFKLATQGLLRVSDSVAVFTIMSNALDSAEYKEILSLATGLELVPVTTGPTILSVPGTDWSMSFTAPAMRGSESGPIDGGYRYAATTGEGFNMSVFVEDAKGSEGHQACADYYWTRMKENPRLDRDTVERSAGEKFHRIDYRLRGEQDGVPFDVPNVHLYFAHEGKWVDVHVSMFPFEESDQKVLDRFVAGFRYNGTGGEVDNAP